MLSIAVILVAGLLLCWPAAAHQITTPAGITVDYSGLLSPATGVSCCNRMDCAPAEVTFDGGERAVDPAARRLSDRLGRPVVPGRPRVILPFSLDGGWHMCKLPRDPGRGASFARLTHRPQLEVAGHPPASTRAAAIGSVIVLVHRSRQKIHQPPSAMACFLWSEPYRERRSVESSERLCTSGLSRGAAKMRRIFQASRARKSQTLFDNHPQPMTKPRRKPVRRRSKPAVRRAGLYARVSTEDRGQDPETQLRPLREYAERRGFDVVGEFVDHASGTTEEPAEVPSASWRPCASASSTWSWSGATTASPARPGRWSTRSASSGAGVAFISYQENVDTTTPQGELVFGMMANLAQFESCADRRAGARPAWPGPRRREAD